MIDRGRGIPVVLIPGVQGRWEWMTSTVDALAARCRVITFSLCDEPTSGFAFDGAAGFDGYVQQIESALDKAGVPRAALIGVSYAGLIATEFAIRHPDRVLALVLTSALPPGWTPDARARFYMRAPRLLTPVFWLTSPLRMFPEVRAALGLMALLRFFLGSAYRALRWAPSPARMARRIGWTESFKFRDTAGLQVPTLIITGEDGLDRIVSPALTREYLTRWPHARHETLSGTGHLGLVTKPKDFANLIGDFLEAITADGERISA